MYQSDVLRVVSNLQSLLGLDTSPFVMAHRWGCIDLTAYGVSGNTYRYNITPGGW